MSLSRHDDPWKVSRKEADSFKIAKPPPQTKFLDYVYDNRNEVFSKCGRGMDGYYWMVEIEDQSIPFEDLVPSASFITLDAKILAAVLKALEPGSNLERKIRNLQKETHKQKADACWETGASYGLRLLCHQQGEARAL